MKNTFALAAVVAALVLSQAVSNASQDEEQQESRSLSLGAFSISLAVEDLAASRDFYAKLGFKSFAGNEEQNWLILQNADRHTIGLFQGMFKENIMTFNPGWSQGAENLKEFMDVRDIQRHLKAEGLELATEADESTTGPASLTLIDPDGNSILIDQHR